MKPLYQYPDHMPPVTSDAALTGPRSKKASSFGWAESVKSNTEIPPWYQAWLITSRPGTGTSVPLWATQFSCEVCGAGIL